MALTVGTGDKVADLGQQPIASSNAALAQSLAEAGSGENIDFVTPKGIIQNKKAHQYFQPPQAQWMPKIQRGMIIRPAMSHDPYEIRFHFMFNPSHVSLGYSYNAAIKNRRTDVTAAAVPMINGVVGVSFGLMIDRTVDHAYSDRPTGINNSADRIINVSPSLSDGSIPPPESHGVMHDMGVFWRMQNKDGYETGQMIVTDMFVTLGGPHTYQFWGWMTSANFEFTHFSHNMTPTRAVLDLQFEKVWGDQYEANYQYQTPSPGPWHDPGKYSAPTTTGGRNRAPIVKGGDEKAVNNPYVGGILP